MDSKVLDAIVENKHVVAWTNPEGVEKTNTLGLLVANYCKWDGGKIVDVALSALEDSNFHGFYCVLEAVRPLLSLTSFEAAPVVERLTAIVQETADQFED